MGIPAQLPPLPHLRPPAESAAGARYAPRPFSADSPWNTPIPRNAGVHPASRRWIARLAGGNRPIYADVDQFTIAVYHVDASTPRVRLKVTAHWSDYSTGTREDFGYGPTIEGVPVPPNATAGGGNDDQVVLWDQGRQLEYGLFRLRRSGGRSRVERGYVASTAGWWPGTFLDGKAGRGAGLPYLGGLVRPEEMAAGRIDHALAFGYRWPAKSFVYPASKTDGRGHPVHDLPDGARLQLDPRLTTAQLRGMGLSREAIVLATAMQRYGMYVVDNSGAPKIYLEERITARWPSWWDRKLLHPLPWSAFRVVQPPPVARPRHAIAHEVR